MSKTPIIKVQNLVASYNHKIILNEINFEVYQGEILMIVGGSGCGKTTLLNHMIGLLAPFSGEVLLDSQNISHATDTVRLLILKKIGVLYQSGALFGSMSLLKNVALPLEELTQLPQTAILNIAYNKLKMVGLENFAHYLPAETSGGMQKRAALARALVLDPKILFLDEPTSGLDPISTSEIDQLVVNLSRSLGTTLVIVSHDITSIHNIADRVVLLNQGKIIAAGTPQELDQSAQPLVRSFFNSKRYNE